MMTNFKKLMLLTVLMFYSTTVFGEESLENLQKTLSYLKGMIDGLRLESSPSTKPKLIDDLIAQKNQVSQKIEAKSKSSNKTGS